VINNDDSYGVKLKGMTVAKIITYGIKNSADVMAKKIKFNCSNTEFRILTPEGEICFKSRLIGRHNVYNILAAFAWGIKAGIGIPTIKSSLEKFYFVPGRLQKINLDAGFSVFVDYAHTEDALKNVIKTLRELAKNRIIVVFGCGGERDKTKRPKMGQVVTELADYAIITNDNPRSEDPLEIINDIKRGIRKKNFCVVPERYEAIKDSLVMAKTGDIVLVAGKGHENYQILKERRVHFDDREVIRECLKSMNY
jgi:UDP-N-acetylmuramoyl-L-alanyl-D-glutamate--2,6-diaminopimelate ligase